MLTMANVGVGSTANPLGPPRMPPEVWDYIFSYLDEPRDCLSAMRTCVEWEDAMKLRKEVILFQNVLPFVAKYVPPKTFISCRRLCRALRGTIDKYLDESHSMANPDNFECHWWQLNSANSGILRVLNRRYNFISNSPNSRITDFLEKMESHNGNPFISRSIKIQFGGRRRFYQPQYDNAVRLLTRFGGGIREFTHYSPGPVILGVITHLPSLLSLVPNLRCFKVGWDMAFFNRRGAQDELEPTFEDVFEFLDSSPFPILPNLTCLSYDLEGEFAFQLGWSLIKAYGHQLTTLMCSGVYFLCHDRIDVHAMNSLLPNLRNLRITRVTPRILRKLCQVNWQIERLQIHGSTGDLPLDDLVKTINKFANSLVQLHIDTALSYTLSDFGGNRSDYEVELSHLKNVSTVLTNLNQTWFWELLQLKCKSVTVLDFETYFDSLLPENETFDKQIYNRDHVLINRLFVLLPKLENVRFWIEDSQECFAIRR